MIYLVIWGIVAVASAVVAALVAQTRGRSQLGWAGLGLLFGPIALLAIAMIPPDPQIVADNKAMAATPAANGPGPFARLAIDLGPLVVFFVTNAFAPVADVFKIFYATGAFMIAMIAAMIFSQIRYKHISPLLLFSGAMVVILGGITIWLHDETFIKMKPTIYYLLVAGLLGFGLATGRNLLKLVLETVYPGLSERGWMLLTRNWVAYFIVMAVINEAVWRTQTTDFWVLFKLWFFLPATFIFAIANVPMLMKHGLQMEEAEKDPPTPPTQ